MLVAAGVVDGVERQAYRVRVLLLGVYGHIDLLAQNAQLLAGGGTVDVGAHQQRTLAARALQLLGQLAREGGLAGSVQTRHQDYGRLALDVERSCVPSHQLGKLVVHYLHHQLLGLQCVDYVLAQGFLLHLVGEGLGYFEVDVGLDQRAAHVLHGLRNVYLGDAALTFQYLE